MIFCFCCYLFCELNNFFSSVYIIVFLSFSKEFVFLFIRKSENFDIVDIIMI